MSPLVFHFDFISPYAYVAWMRLVPPPSHPFNPVPRDSSLLDRAPSAVRPGGR